MHQNYHTQFSLRPHLKQETTLCSHAQSKLVVLSLPLGEREETTGVMRQLAGLLAAVVAITTITTISEGAIPTNILKKVMMVNKKGPFLGLVVPNSFEMSPLLQSSKFVQSKKLPYLVFGGN